eukprot:175409_1
MYYNPHQIIMPLMLATSDTEETYIEDKCIIKYPATLSSTSLFHVEIPSPLEFEKYLGEHYDVLHIMDDEIMNGERISHKEKEYVVNKWIKEDLTNKYSFVKYLFAFRIYSKQFLKKKALLFHDIISENDIKCDLNVIELLLSFVYDDMSYLKYSTKDAELQLVNQSLEMYGYLDCRWRTWIYDNYILKIPKEDLAKLKSFAYLLFL